PPVGPGLRSLPSGARRHAAADEELVRSLDPLLDRLGAAAAVVDPQRALVGVDVVAGLRTHVRLAVSAGVAGRGQHRHEGVPLGLALVDAEHRARRALDDTLGHVPGPPAYQTAATRLMYLRATRRSAASLRAISALPFRSNN